MQKIKTMTLLMSEEDHARIAYMQQLYNMQGNKLNKSQAVIRCVREFYEKANAIKLSDDRDLLLATIAASVAKIQAISNDKKAEKDSATLAAKVAEKIQPSDTEFMTPTEVRDYLGVDISFNDLARIVRDMGVKSQRRSVGGVVKRLYYVKKV